MIARELRSKNSKQCRRRWKNVLTLENTKFGDWTAEEDRTLLHEHREHGNKWETLAQLVGGRSPPPPPPGGGSMGCIASSGLLALPTTSRAAEMSRAESSYLHSEQQ